MVPFARLDPALRGIVNIVQTRLLEKGKERETLGMAGISWHRSHGVDSGVLFVECKCRSIGRHDAQTPTGMDV